MPTAKVYRQCQSVIAHAERLGLDADYQIAGTGSMYVMVTAPDGQQLKIRVADHGQCYPCDYTVDGLCGTLAGAKQFMSAWLTKLRAADAEIDEVIAEHEAEQREHAAWVRQLKAAARKHRAVRGDYVLTAAGEQWGPLDFWAKRTHSIAAMQVAIRELETSIATQPVGAAQ